MTSGILISAVQVVDRHRTDLGDLADLAASLAAVGLMNPITLTPNGRLVAGQRRLEAAKSLGWTHIEAHIVDCLSDATAALTAERDENTCRKEMTPSECVALGMAIEALERPKAKERQVEGARIGAAITNNSPSVPANGRRPNADTREVVAPAVGMSTATYSRAKQIVTAASDETLDEETRARAQAAIVEMDTTGKVTPAYEKFKGEKVNRGDDAPRSRQRPTAATEAPAKPERHELLRKTKHLNPQRIAREAVLSLEGIAFTVSLIDDFSQIDGAQAQEWADSLTNSLRALNRFSKQIKETTHVLTEE